MNRPELIYSFIVGLGLENQFPSVFCYLKNGEMGIVKDCLIYTYNNSYYISNELNMVNDSNKHLFFISRKDADYFYSTGDDSLSIIKIINKGNYYLTLGDYNNFKFDNND